MTNDLVIVV